MTPVQLAILEQGLRQCHDTVSNCVDALARLADEEMGSNVYDLGRHNAIFAEIERAHDAFMDEWRRSGFPLPPRRRA